MVSRTASNTSRPASRIVQAAPTFTSAHPTHYSRSSTADGSPCTLRWPQATPTNASQSDASKEHPPIPKYNPPIPFYIPPISTDDIDDDSKPTKSLGSLAHRKRSADARSPEPSNENSSGLGTPPQSDDGKFAQTTAPSGQYSGAMSIMNYFLRQEVPDYQNPYHPSYRRREPQSSYYGPKNDLDRNPSWRQDNPSRAAGDGEPGRQVKRRG
jgi:hypothetical protein